MCKRTRSLLILLVSCSPTLTSGQEKASDPTPEAVRRVDEAYVRIGATPDHTRNADTQKIDYLYRLPAKTTDDDLEKLPASPFPFGLNLVGTKVTNKGLSKLKGLDSLNNLVLPSGYLTDEGLAGLKSAGLVHALAQASGKNSSRPTGPKEVRQLNLYREKITTRGLRHLDGLTNLNTLSVPEAEETDEMLQTLLNIGLLHAWRSATAKWGTRPESAKDVFEVQLLSRKFTDTGLKELQAFVNLQSLWLDSSAVTPAGLTQLNGLTKLNYLRLRDDQLTDDALTALQKAGLLHAVDRAWRKGQTDRPTKPEEVTHLDLSIGSHIGDQGVGVLRAFSHLQSLQLSAPKMTSAGVEHLAAFKELTELTLPDIKLTDDAVKAVAGLTELTTLTLGQEVTADQLRHLKSLKKLTTLDCRRLTDDKLRALREVGLLHTLKQATGSWFDRPGKPENVLKFELLSAEDVTPAGLKELAAFKKLRELDLGGRDHAITDDELKALRDADLLHTVIGMTVLERVRPAERNSVVREYVRASGREEVEEVELVGSHVTDDGLKELVPLKNLKRLTVDSDRLTGTGLKHLEGLKTLRALHLTGEKLSTDGLGQLRLFPQLTELSVGNCDLSTDGIKSIAVLENLKTLKLDLVPITEEGAKELTRLKGNPTLKLTVRGDAAPVLKGLQGVKGLTSLGFQNGVPEASFKELATLTSLTKLYLCPTYVSDDGLKELQSLKSLTWLEFDGGKATPEGIQAFRNAVPGCRLYIEE